MADDLLPNIFGLTMLGGGALFCGWYGMKRLGQARLMADTPTSRIRSAAQGFVELKGVLAALPTGLIEAPLTGLPCLWWRYRIEEYRKSSGKNNSSSWHTIESGSSEALMVLRDETGECLISPVGAEVHCSSKDQWRGNQRHPRRAEPERGIIGTLLQGGRSYRYTEERLHVGEALYALGEFRTSGGGREGMDLEKGRREVVREWKEDFQGLIGRFDRNGDGQLDEMEWQRVLHAASKEAERRHKVKSQQMPELNTLRRPKESYPYILSCHGEKQLGGRLRWQGIAGLLLCLILTGATVWAGIRVGLIPVV